MLRKLFACAVPTAAVALTALLFSSTTAAVSASGVSVHKKKGPSHPKSHPHPHRTHHTARAPQRSPHVSNNKRIVPVTRTTPIRQPNRPIEARAIRPFEVRPVTIRPVGGLDRVLPTSIVARRVMPNRVTPVRATEPPAQPIRITPLRVTVPSPQ